jgi:hypothetical protein
MEHRYCDITYCLNYAAKGRKRCNKCRSRLYRAKHKLVATYHINKANATRRGISWELSLKDFESFCIENNYLEFKGLTPDSYSIDRIKSDIGYTATNIQVLTLADNTTKANKERKTRKNWSKTSVPRMPDDIF